MLCAYPLSLFPGQDESVASLLVHYPTSPKTDGLCRVIMRSCHVILALLRAGKQPTQVLRKSSSICARLVDLAQTTAVSEASALAFPTTYATNGFEALVPFSAAHSKRYSQRLSCLVPSQASHSQASTCSKSRRECEVMCILSALQATTAT